MKLEEIVDKPEGALELMEVDNERMEFLGDSVLGFVVAKYIYERFEDQNEGFLTRIKTKLVNCDALHYFSKELGFAEYILMSRFVDDKCGGRKSVKILEDVFESFIGALYLDFNETDIPNYDFYSGIGFHICEKFLINLIEAKVDFSDLIKNDYNYKDFGIRYRINRGVLGVAGSGGAAQMGVGADCNYSKNVTTTLCAVKSDEKSSKCGRYRRAGPGC